MIRTLDFRGDKGTAKLNALFNSGSTYSCLNPATAERLSTVLKLSSPLKIDTLSRGRFIQIEDRVTLDFYLNNLRLTDEFMFVPGLAEKAIIGATTMQKWRIKLDFGHDEIITDPRANRMILR